MRHLISLVFMLSIAANYAQEKLITFDYTVEYVIPVERKSTSDTLVVCYDKEGKYIWTNSKGLAKELGRSVFRRNKKLLENSSVGILYSAESSELTMYFESGKNRLFFNFELEALLPQSKRYNDNEDKEFELISENTNKTIEILDRHATLYEIYPSNQDSEIVEVAFDESIAINNNAFLRKIFESVFASRGGSILLGFNIPDGLVMQVSEKGKTVLEAHHIDTTQKTININYSCNITE